MRPDNFGFLGHSRQEVRVCKVKLLVEVSFELGTLHIFFNLLRDRLDAFVGLGFVEVEGREVGQEGRFHFFILDIFPSDPANPRVNQDLLNPVH